MFLSRWIQGWSLSAKNTGQRGKLIGVGFLFVSFLIMINGCANNPRPSPPIPSDGQLSFDSAPSPEGDLFVYVGTYTGGKSVGIYIFNFSLKTGKLTPIGVAAGIDNPSFLALHPNGQFLYAVNEIGNFNGKEQGAVSAFRRNSETGLLTFLNQQPSNGAAPCHLVVDAVGENVLVANYNGGNAAVLPIQDDGKLDEPSWTVRHSGSSVNAGRQEKPHAHSINLDSANRYAFVADLGIDRIAVYGFNSEKGMLESKGDLWVSLKPGAGPRHFTFTPNGQFAYVINELDSTVTGFQYDASKGALKEIQNVSTLPAGNKVDNSTAELVVHPSGKFLYGSNRGHHSIVVYRIDPQSGQLTWVENESVRGKTPRNFAIDPTGRFLLAENQGSDNIKTFRINTQTGELEYSGHSVDVPSPVCIKFAVK